MKDAACLPRLRAIISKGLKDHGSYRKLSAVVGVPAPTLQRIATGKIVPSIVTADRIARALKRELWLGLPE